MAPFNSPQPYSISNIPCDGGIHSIKAEFSDDPTCNLTQTYNAPSQNCPSATISGGGAICNDGVSTANILVTLIGTGPFTFEYALNGTPQPPITTSNSSYTITTCVAGTYTLLSISNGSACPMPGTVSGQAIVSLNPVPVITLTGNDNLCQGTANVIYTTEAGFFNYQWLVSPGGTITAGGGTTNNTATVTWNTSGSQSVSVLYQGPAPTNCAPINPVVLPVTVNPLPVPTITGPASACVNSTGNIYFTETGMTGYTWVVSAGGTITAGAATEAITVTWQPTAPKTVRVNYTNENS